MADQELYSIGKIVAPHGVRGDVRIIPLTDFPERFQDLKTVYVEDSTRKVEVKSVRYHKQFILLKFVGYNTMNDVEQFRGKLLKVPREELMILPAGHYYVFDIIGLKVYEESGDYLGTITDVLETGSNDVYVIEKEENQKPILIPALKKVVKRIDIAGKQMIVALQEEWE
ncbi:MAG TPA: ribosome maturation factor RimM [Methylomusa anaerophila]|uniref:Ribosome maturation factor RimM n=1 Tax=Methylomusa anaerophila TaxID=1930071 RepID=A0A348AQ68_9FIRM|nr:ribosome maturation factor RimM [Methylomusa anaerophila]BBB93216.1 ribosome maturation factor RimM [Methylomusa anaerophila]HML86952.1 ribosome maturation factor RimM [Methylomusa anaerophila]